jgi:hypothetical protein
MSRIGILFWSGQATDEQRIGPVSLFSVPESRTDELRRDLIVQGNSAATAEPSGLLLHLWRATVMTEVTSMTIRCGKSHSRYLGGNSMRAGFPSCPVCFTLSQAWCVLLGQERSSLSSCLPRLANQLLLLSILWPACNAEPSARFQGESDTE